MSRKLVFLLTFALGVAQATAQYDADYIRQHAVQIDNPEALNDSVNRLLSPFNLILFGEMHGTNESTPFVLGMANLLTGNGDSVQVGLEIAASEMKAFLSLLTDSSIYQSEFFHKAQSSSGKETTAWASLISKLNDNPHVQLFFFDMNDEDGKIEQRDSIMSEKIKKQILEHPSWKMITLSGNYHNRISGEPTMASYLLRDTMLKICTLNMEYTGGTALANFGKGLEIRQLGGNPTAFNTIFPWNHFLLLVSPESNYPYNGYYYTRMITAAKLTHKE